MLVLQGLHGFGILLTLAVEEPVTGRRRLLRPTIIVMLCAVLAVAACPPAGAQGQTIQDRIEARQLASRQAEDRREHRAYVDSNGIPTFKSIKPKVSSRRTRDTRVQKLERVKVPVTLKTAPATGSVEAIVKHYATLYQLKENLVYAVIQCESAFDPAAVSPAGARGLMQLMPGTALEMGVTDIHDPAENIAGGTQYLAKMLDRFNGDVKLALAGYNAGPEAVARYDGIPPYEETKTYVARVMKEFAAYEGGTAPSHLLRSGASSVRKVPARTQAPPRYVIHFKHGLTQPVHGIEEEGPYYHVRFGNRTYYVRKEMVEEITEAA